MYQEHEPLFPILFPFFQLALGFMVKMVMIMMMMMMMMMLLVKIGGVSHKNLIYAEYVGVEGRTKVYMYVLGESGWVVQKPLLS